MDFEDIESELSSGILSVARSTHEREFVENSRHCERKSPRKKPKMTSALMIDQLKNDFPNPAFRDGYNAPRTRTRRNWRPQFLMRYLIRGGDRRGCNEEYITLQRGRSYSANLVAEAPRIYSIGLRSGARSATNVVVDDPRASPLAAMRDCKKRSGIVRRAMIVCKYWIAQTTATSTVMPANHRTTMLDRTDSAVLRKLDRKANRSRDDRSCERAQERQRKRNNDPAAALQDDRTVSDRSCTFDFADLPARQYHKQIASEFGVTKKDAQIQTSSRKSSRRRKRRKSRSRTTSEGIVGRPTGRDSNGTNRSDRSRLSVRALESKRAEYVKKFTAVNRRIEEITAALRETCYGDGSPRNNAEHRERRFLSSTTRDDDDDTRAMDVTRESDDYVDVNHAVRKRNGVSANVERIIVGESENDRLRKSVRRILRFSSRLNNDTAFSLGKEYPEGVTVPSTRPDGRLNANDICVRDSVRAYAIKETFRPSERTAGRRKGTIYHDINEILKQISADLDLARRDDEIREFSIDNEFLDEARYSRDNFPNGDERAKVSIEDLVDSERSKSCNEVVVGKIGELTILEDIKRRIDKDFDGPSTRSEDEDLLAVSREDFNFENDDRPVATFEKSASASLIVHGSSYSDASEIQIRDSMSTDAVSERSNRTSTLSKYHSCTQFPSLISLRENENDELAHEVEDRSTIVRSDSCSELRTNTDYQDLNASSYVERSHSDVSSNRDRSHLNFGSRFDQSLISMGYVARRPWPTKFLTGMTNERNDMSPNVIQEEENRIGERECSLGESDGKVQDTRVNLEKRYAADCTLETSKSSRYIGSIDSGVFFSSSLIDLCPHEASFDGDAKKPSSARRKKQRRARKCDESPPTFDFSSDSNCNDDAHDRRVDDVVRDLTRNLILCERRARTKLKEMRRTLIRARDARYPRHTSSSHTRKFSKNLDVHYGFFDSARWRNEDERIVGVSTPSLLSSSSSEVEEHESSCQLNGIRPL